MCKPLRDDRQPKYIRDRVRISKYDLPFKKVHKLQFTQEVFEIATIATSKPSTYKSKDDEYGIIHAILYQKSWWKSFNSGIVQN